MKASEFDKQLDKGEDVVQHPDLRRARRPGWEPTPVSMDLPLWMVHLLDKEAKRLGVSRQSIIKIWVADHLEKASAMRRFWR